MAASVKCCDPLARVLCAMNADSISGVIGIIVLAHHPATAAFRDDGGIGHIYADSTLKPSEGLSHSIPQ